MRIEKVWTSFEARFVENPAYLSVIVRWITFAVAAAVVVFRAAPLENLAHAPLALVLVFGCCVLITLGPFVRRRKPVGKGTLLGIVADIIFSNGIIFITGGFRSPFYEFALTSVIAPALLYGMEGAILAAVAFNGLYFLAVNYSAPGFDAAIRMGETDGTLFSSITNPFTVGIFCALLGQVVQRLHEAREQARSLAAAEERTRIAREIHDGIAQRIFMLTLNLETCAELSHRALHCEMGRTADDESGLNAQRLADLESRLDGLMKLSKQALLEVRHYIFDVKPLLEGEQTLCASLHSQVKEFEAVSGMRVAFQVEGEELRLTVPVKSAIFRIVQEAMANAYKHARAAQLDLRVGFETKSVSIVIEDHGEGFEPSCQERRRGLGLEGMRQRAEEAGGTFTLESAPGLGTRIAVSMPYAPVRARSKKEQVRPRE